ncbi:PhoH family protein [Deinococcus aerius]|uniref:PhoH-like protein n=1 Tax=Deinococcus aerius TaxID=200253 RepID=A0A2I9CT71_9DEIO|nr:PhoH family protein [Deinococcus aerius]
MTERNPGQPSPAPTEPTNGGTSATLHLANQREAFALLGAGDANLRRMRELTPAKIIARGETVTITGEQADVQAAERMVRDALDVVRTGGELTPESLLRSARLSGEGRSLAQETQVNGLSLPRGLKAKTPGQKVYLEKIEASDITFGVGPAGTGKTYLAVAMAVQALKAKKVKRIILTRPAVEAGERLGFLPGDLQAKIDPYLRPLYDALYDMLDQEKFESYLTSGVIEVAPLAFMRGRAQPLTAKVLTPLGWREMGSLEVGDHVIGSDGRPTRVLGVYPQGEKDTYRVTFSDGSSVECCEEHLWTVYTASDKRRGKPGRVLETREMMGNLRSAHQYRYEIPMLGAPAELPEQPVPLDPYALGLLLGDGCTTCTTTPGFSTADPELVTALEVALNPAEAEPVLAVTHKGRYDYTLRHTAGGRGGLRVANPVTTALRTLGLDGKTSSQKFVPEVYRQNSAAVRLAVLQGLLDTDGGPVTQAGRTCRIQYTTTSAQLAEDVTELVQSLGGVARRRTRAAQGRTPGQANGRPVPYRHDAHVLEIRLPAHVAPFRLRRKAERYAAFGGGGRPTRFITNIERVGRAPMQCIRVAAEDALYVTEHFVVTHNTLNDAFVILDEAQNTTGEQMKMFLTRMGFSSKVVVTGDVTQIDLPRHVTSGLAVAKRVLSRIEGIAWHEFTDVDVVRHPLVGRIIKAYEAVEEAEQDKRAARRGEFANISEDDAS